MAADPIEDIGPEAAKQLIDESDSAMVVSINAEPVPSIGTISPLDRDVKITSQLYRVVDE